MDKLEFTAWGGVNQTLGSRGIRIRKCGRHIWKLLVFAAPAHLKNGIFLWNLNRKSHECKTKNISKEEKYIYIYNFLFWRSSALTMVVVGPYVVGCVNFSKKSKIIKHNPGKYQVLLRDFRTTFIFLIRQT